MISYNTNVNALIPSQGGAPPILPTSLDPMPCNGCTGAPTPIRAGAIPAGTVPLGQPANTATAGLSVATGPVTSPCDGCGKGLRGVPWWVLALAAIGGYFALKKILG